MTLGDVSDHHCSRATGRDLAAARRAGRIVFVAAALAAIPTLRAPGAAVTTSWAGPTSGNWIDGGGCSVNIAEQGRGPAAGLVFKSNRFGRDTRVVDCAIIAPSTTAAVLTLSGNTYTDGETVTVHRGS